MLLLPAVLLLSAVTIYAKLAVRGMLSGEDSWRPMADALNVHAAGLPIYQELFYGRGEKFQYPLSSLLPLQALRGLGLGSVSYLDGMNLLLAAADALAMGALAWCLIGQTVRPPLPRVRWALCGAAAASVAVCYPIIRGLELGQIQIWLDLCVTLACLALLQRQDGWAGAAMGFSAAIKPQFIPLLALAALGRYWRFCLGFAAVLGAMLAAAALIFGVADNLAYLGVLQYISRHGESFYANSTINGVMNRLLGNGSNLVWQPHDFAPFNGAVYAATALSSIVLLALPFAVRPRQPQPTDRLLHFGVCIVCSVIASPIAWEHHFGVLPPVFLIAAAAVAGEQPARRLTSTLWLGIAWVLVASKLWPLTNHLSQSWLNPLQATPLIGAFVLLGVLLRALRAPRYHAAARASM